MITEIIDRLTDKAPSLTTVSPAEDLEALGKGVAPKNGATFVMPFQDRPEPNRLMTGGFRQRVEVLFLVAFVLRRADDPKGGQRAGSFDDFTAAIEGALAGWSPDDREHAPFELVAGRSASLGNSVIIYVQTWRTNRFIRGAQA